jgi:hypothetical protein
MCFHIPQDAWPLWPQLLLLFLKAPISGAHNDFPPFYPQLLVLPFAVPTAPMASQPESRLWQFDADMQVITHEDSKCAVCDPWIAHFALASARHDVTLAVAE